MHCVIQNLSKSYSAGFTLGPIDMSIGPGEIVGLLGSNGAGKTSLIRLLLGVLKPDTGAVHLMGVNVRDQYLARRWIGYLDEEPIHYDWMKIKWLARFYSSYYPNWDNSQFTNQLEAFSLDQSTKVGHLSKGNKIRLGFALALAHSPRLLLLDEPTSGLDPMARVEILDAMAHYTDTHSEVSVLFSSHITTDLERICNRAVILEHGRVISDDQIKTASRREGTSHLTRTPTLEEELLNALASAQIQ